MKQLGDLRNKEMCGVYRSPRIIKSGRKLGAIYRSDDGDAECIHSFDGEAAGEAAKWKTGKEIIRQHSVAVP
jgi:hypothetical protein